MTWTKTTKSSSKYLRKQGSVKVTRGRFGGFNSRGAIALEIHGDASAEVTRKDMEYRFGTKIANSFTETGKGSSDWSEKE